MAFLVLTAVPDRRTGARLARVLVQKRLAACASFLPGSFSVYRWKGKIETAREGLLLIKTVKKKFAGVSAVIRSHHPYELPEIVGLKIAAGSPDYLSWLERCVR